MIELTDFANVKRYQKGAEIRSKADLGATQLAATYRRIGTPLFNIANAAAVTVTGKVAATAWERGSSRE